MIERVAKAIHIRQSYQRFNCILTVWRQKEMSFKYIEETVEQAKDAIKAMREPTEKMVSAGMDGDSLEVGSSAFGCWQDMIDAVIND